MDKIEPAVASHVGRTHLSIDTVESELTQAKRRVQRAGWAEKIQNRDTPLARDLDKLFRDIENLQLAFGLKDKEVENDV
jgi:hypothetical protein